MTNEQTTRQNLLETVLGQQLIISLLESQVKERVEVNTEPWQYEYFAKVIQNDLTVLWEVVVDYDIRGSFKEKADASLFLLFFKKKEK